MAAIQETETGFQAKVLELAILKGFTGYHTYDSRKSAFGFPDLVLIRPPRVLFAELKSERGKLSTFQEEYRDLLLACPGVEYYLWRPSDWNEVVEVLSREGSWS